ncbi:hypothetical protein MTO96_042077 [Rhipicephalus appendiculatus]
MKVFQLGQLAILLGVVRTPQREVINNPQLPIVARRSQAIRVGDTLYVSGARGIDPRTGKLVKGGIVEQTRQTLQNLKLVLETGQMTVEDVVKCTVFITNQSYFDVLNKEYLKVFTEAPPARTTAQVVWLTEDSLVEIEAIAVDTKNTKCFALPRSNL